MAGKIQATVFGFDKQKAHTAVERIIADVEAENCNCLEITEVRMESFLGFPYACVSAHSLRVQGNQVFGA